MPAENWSVTDKESKKEEVAQVLDRVFEGFTNTVKQDSRARTPWGAIEILKETIDKEIAK